MLLFVMAPLRRRFRAWNKQRGFESRLRAHSADSPEAAVRVDDTVQANRALKQMKCGTCGSALSQDVPKSYDIRHDGVHLLMLEAGCTKCDDLTIRYFRFR
jgi:hypothetical protein